MSEARSQSNIQLTGEFLWTDRNDWASAGITQWLHALLNAHLDRHWPLTIRIPHKTSIARLPEVWREFGLFPCKLHSEAEILRICECTV